MTISQAIIAYVVAWWMVLLMAAPVASGRTTDENRVKIWAIKLLVTSAGAALVTWGVDFIIRSGIVVVK